jgi:hypothetical protein
MLDIRIVLSGIWVALMLSYLLGDVLRLFSGDYAKMSTKDEVVKMLIHSPNSQNLWLLIALIMVTPIFMVILSLVLPYSINRWVNILVAVFFFLFNLSSLPTYPSMYDKFLNVVGLVFNVITIYYAWNWVETA